MNFDQIEGKNQEISPMKWRNEALFEDNIIPNTAIDFDRAYERKRD